MSFWTHEQQQNIKWWSNERFMYANKINVFAANQFSLMYMPASPAPTSCRTHCKNPHYLSL